MALLLSMPSGFLTAMAIVPPVLPSPPVPTVVKVTSVPEEFTVPGSDSPLTSTVASGKKAFPRSTTVVEGGMEAGTLGASSIGLILTLKRLLSTLSTNRLT
ncbi:hypothetical protein D9M68_906280 [compost metagenome]